MEAIFELKEKHCRKHVNKVNHGHLLRVSVAVDGVTDCSHLGQENGLQF